MPGATLSLPGTLKAAVSVAKADVRSAQRYWAETSIRRRLAVVRNIRDLIAARARVLADLFPPDLMRSRAESLTSEIIPLAESCRFLQTEAERILAPRRLSNSSRPTWLRAIDVEVLREPLGVILIIGPSNYPLFLAGVQCLQALVAGNGVIVKPGRGAGAVLDAFRGLAIEAGILPSLFHVLDESVEAGTFTIREGVDKIVLTGDVNSGRAVLREAAETVTPAVMELSGNDPVFIFEGADLHRAAAAVSFGLTLTRGATCIAPRHVFVLAKYQARFQNLLASELRQRGAHDPLLPVTAVDNADEALEFSSRNYYSLGATIFGDPTLAAQFARRVSAGVIVINDLIVPTADPRVPFGGRKLSGFGTTRGEEGLLEFTAVKAVVTQKAERLRHLEPQPVNADELFLAFLSASHRSGRRRRLLGWLGVLKSILQSRRKAA